MAENLQGCAVGSAWRRENPGSQWKSEESRTAAQLERRQIGAQFAVIDTARLPERPLGPSRLGVNIMGAFAGFAVGLALISVRGRSKKMPE